MARSNKPSILIVEDEGIITENLRQTLTELGYDAEATAASSDEAIARATERCPDLVLMDVRIRGRRDGIETAAILRERFGAPVLYLTAHADVATLERAKQTNPLGYLVKPIKQGELRSAIEIALYRHGMERRLRERERWFHTTLESIADAVVAVDLGGNISFMNPTAEKLAGVRLADAMGRPARDVLRLDTDDQQEKDPLERAMRERRVVHLEEVRLKGANGSAALISDSTAPVMEGDALLGAVMVFHDISEERRLQQKVEMADRLASLGTMAAGVAHEVNNPLAVVVSNGEVVMHGLEAMLALSARPGVPRELPRLLHEAMLAQRDLQAAASRITRIVSELREFSRPDPDAVGSADVARALDWAVRVTAHEFRHRARVVVSVAETPRVAIDETKLGQVLVNLLLNSAQAIPAGNVAENEVSIVSRANTGGRVSIEVKDSGPGIPAEIQKHIFDPFFSTKPVGVGTGLGLSICHGIVSSCGGDIELESKPGAGTLFRVTLPAATAPALQGECTPEAPAATHLVGRILAIDDEELVLRALTRLLRGNEVVCRANARDALLLLERGERFDVILCDVMMPNMTGIAFFDELVRTRPDCVPNVVFMTGGTTTKAIGDFLATIPNGNLVKPFELEQLTRAVQAVLVRGRQDAAPHAGA